MEVDTLNAVAQSVSVQDFWEPRSVALDFAYWLVAMCVVYKLTWIIRQTSDMPAKSRMPVKWTAVVLAFCLILKSLSRFYGGDPATYFDIAREFSLCMFLATTIKMLHRETKRY